MKKVVLASLLACAAIVSGVASASAQQPVALGSGPAACPPMADQEYAAYNNASAQKDPKAQAAAYEAYLTAFPQSCVKLPTLVILMTIYYQLGDGPHAIDAANRVLQLDPNNLRADLIEVIFNGQAANAVTDAAAKQAPLDTAASFAQKGLAATKPADMSDADFKTLQTLAIPIFYSAIGTAALNKKDAATAIDAFKKELASVPLAQTQTPDLQLQDTYFLGTAYAQSTPPDYLTCAFYVARFLDYAPDANKAQFAPTGKWCYRQFHGGDDGYDAVMAVAKDNLNPPAGFQASVKPAPTPADLVKNVIATTPDLSTLAIGDKEFILQNGTPEQAAKVWDTIKGKSYQLPGVLVIASTPTQIQAAVSDNAVQTKTADFTFNMAPPEEIPELKPGATPAQKAAYKKKKEAADKLAADIAEATAVNKTVTLSGTYDSFTPNPIMITMTNGAVILPEAPKKPAAPVHHTAAPRK